MKEPISSIQPNTTQVPNIILDEWMARLSDVELRVLLVVVRQTLGWIEDPETKKRKEKDWISRSQLCFKAGKGKVSVSGAVKTLIEDHRIIEAVDSKGRLLDTSEKRMKIGAGGKIFYRLNVHAPQISLFDTPKKAVQKVNTSQKAVQKKAPFFMNTTKETQDIQKNNLATESHREQNMAKTKEKSPHALFMEFWSSTVEKTRGFKPKITGADGMNLKRVLATGIDQTDLEKISIFFLADPSFKKFSPTLSTMLSAGILNGLINRTKNDPEFYKNLDRYADRYLPRRPLVPGARVNSSGSIAECLSTLMHKFKMPGSESREEIYQR